MRAFTGGVLTVSKSRQMDDDALCRELSRQVARAIWPHGAGRPESRPEAATAALIGTLTAILISARGLPPTQEVYNELSLHIFASVREWITAYHGRN